MRRAGFTLIELLVVVAIIGLLMSVLLPSLRAAREQAKSAVCSSNLRQLALGWQMYADDSGGVCLPMRYANAGGGASNPDNYYSVGNGRKYRPRWISLMGRHVGLFAFSTPEPANDRQDYDGQAYRCPSAPEWMDERNHAYGYNYQFLGNGRKSNDRYINFPVSRSRITHAAETVLAADALGTAAGFASDARLPYENDGTDFAQLGNHGYTLDPPRLTDGSDRGTGDAGSPRTGVAARHRERTSALFVDGHVVARTAFDLGYRFLPDGRFMDSDTTPAGGTIDELPTNRWFSGNARDEDPPLKP